MTSAIMPLRSIGKIIRKTPCYTWREHLFFGHLEKNLKEQQTQVNLFLNKKSTPWFKVLKFITYWLPVFKKLRSPFLNAFMQTRLQQSTWWNSPILHVPSENKGQGRRTCFSSENIFLWWWIHQKWKLDLTDTWIGYFVPIEKRTPLCHYKYHPLSPCDGLLWTPLLEYNFQLYS